MKKKYVEPKIESVFTNKDVLVASPSDEEFGEFWQEFDLWLEL